MSIRLKFFRNESGFTLVELLVSLVITVIGLFGLLQAVEIATSQRIQTQMRDEMAQVAEGQMNSWRALPFTSLSTCPPPTCTDGRYTYGTKGVPTRLRGLVKNYRVDRFTIVSSDGSTVDLGVRVHSWVYKNNSTAIEMHSVRAQ